MPPMAIERFGAEPLKGASAAGRRLGSIVDRGSR